MVDYVREIEQEIEINLLLGAANAQRSIVGLTVVDGSIRIHGIPKVPLEALFTMMSPTDVDKRQLNMKLDFES